ncbi:MAG TPA: hypothetical protein VJU14_14380 [Solirubrobacterales bacterium]|nr:hypothetical protein [Solirubrobacterales bacterium]
MRDGGLGDRQESRRGGPPGADPTEAAVLDETEGEIGGVLLFAKDGCLNQLEVYSFGEEPIRPLPSPARLIIR